MRSSGRSAIFAAVPVLAAVQAFAPAVQDLLETGPREPARHELVPVWLDRLAQISWRTLVVLALLAVVSQAIVLPILSLPVILAAILACVLRPIARKFRERGAGPTAAAALATSASVAAVLLIIGITIWGLISSLPDVVSTTTLGAGSLNLGTTPVELIRWIGDGLLATAAAVISNAAQFAIGIAIALRPDVLPAARRGGLVGGDPGPHSDEPARPGSTTRAASRWTSCTDRWSARRSCRSRAP